MGEPVKLGVIGCGKISDAYFTAAAKFHNIRITRVADRMPEAARSKADTYGFTASTVDELLADPELAIIVNLTTPQSHTELNERILRAGKHSYSEKPFGLDTASGRRVLEIARKLGLKTGSAPDTFLGGAQQTCRELIDGGAIGRVVSGTAFMMCHGHESWHPNPGFYYLHGGGPLFDMGPYYLTALVNLLGPVRQVAAIASRAFTERVATAPGIEGLRLPVEVDTHVAGILEFVSGAVITLVTSFDVWKHTCHNIELHGTAGSLRVPDPNCFGGGIELFQPQMQEWTPVALTHGFTDNLRSIGVADLARSLSGGVPARASGELAYHVLEVMEALERSSHEKTHITVESRPERPAPLADSELQ